MKQSILVVLVMSFISIFVGTSMVFVMTFLGLLTVTSLAESKGFDEFFKSMRRSEQVVEQVKEELPTFDKSKELIKGKVPEVKILPIEAPKPVVRPEPVEQPKPTVPLPVEEPEKKEVPEVEEEDDEEKEPIKKLPVEKPPVEVAPKDDTHFWSGDGNPEWRKDSPGKIYLEDYDSTKIKRKFIRKRRK